MLQQSSSPSYFSLLREPPFSRKREYEADRALPRPLHPRNHPDGCPPSRHIQTDRLFPVPSSYETQVLPVEAGGASHSLFLCSRHLSSDHFISATGHRQFNCWQRSRNFGVRKYFFLQLVPKQLVVNINARTCSRLFLTAMDPHPLSVILHR